MLYYKIVILMKGYCNMHRYILKLYEVGVLQKMKEPLLKEPLLKVRIKSVHQQGFTLIELMITLAVLAVILSLAAPSFVTFINNNRVTGATNDLIASFSLARIEAIKSNATALIQSKNGSADWAGGHRIGIDLNNDGDILDANELLRNVDAPHSSVTMTSASSALSEVSYKPNGGVTAVTTITIDSRPSGDCDPYVKQREIQLGLSGSSTLTVSARACP